jgi:hypothetical protein
LGVIKEEGSVRGHMCTEYLVREYYNEMYRIHTQPGNGYDAGDDLYHLTVHKHLDQDPLTQFREAFGWVDQSRARLIADAGCGYGGFAVFVAHQSRARWQRSGRVLPASRSATKSWPTRGSAAGNARCAGRARNYCASIPAPSAPDGRRLWYTRDRAKWPLPSSP